MDGTLTGPFRVRVDLRVMTIKSYYTLFRGQELKSHHRTHYNVISITFLR